MKINLIYAIAMAGAVFAVAGCQPKSEQGGHHHDASLQLTAYNDDFEVFAEVEPLAAGNESAVAAVWISSAVVSIPSIIGFIPLLNYLLEMEYWQEAYEEKLRSERDLNLAWAELEACKL